MIYDKNDAKMTRGYAILAMVVLHLFCRKGADVYGTPLIWLSDTVPLVYWFGFFAEICVHTYSMCAGYAQQLMVENNRYSYRSNLKRIFKLLCNYWIVLVLFSFVGIVFGKIEVIPTDAMSFVKSIFLLHSYNGAWWYLKTYIILLLIPASVLLLPVRKFEWKKGLLLCFIVDVIYYLLKRFGFLPTVPDTLPVLKFIVTELYHLFQVIAAFWTGAFLCKGKAVEEADHLLSAHLSKHRNTLLGGLFLLIFVVFNITEKSVLTWSVALGTFLIFNLWKKPAWIKKMFLFLGDHSTNIWLTHMFFYCTLFVGLTQLAKYPIVMLLFNLFLCIVSSYAIKGIQRVLIKTSSHLNRAASTKRHNT